MIIDINVIILFANVFVFMLFGIDKSLSKKKGAERVPEMIFHLFSLFFCAMGSILGMVVFNHKTSKMTFRIWTPLCLIANYYFNLDGFSLLKSLLNWFLALLG